MRNLQQLAQDASDRRDSLIRVCDRYEIGLARYGQSNWESLDKARAKVRAVRHTLPLSRIVIWTSEMSKLSMAGAERALAGKKAPEFLDIEQPEWWVFAGFQFRFPSGNIHFPNSTIAPSDMVLSELLLVPQSRRLIVCSTFYGDHDLDARVPNSRIPHFEFTEINTDDRITTSFDLNILAGRAFMRSTVGACEPIVLPRATRRRALKHQAELPDVRIVTLRRAESAQREASASRVYRYQHIVSGHWRHLKFPRKSDGATYTFVRAHVKGPKGAPLLPPRETVYGVTR